MPLQRLLFAAVIGCFLIVHYIALRQIGALATDNATVPHTREQPTD